MLKRDRPYNLYFYSFLFLSTFFRLCYIPNINLSPDEAYYWNWSRDLQLSYYDHPPMVAYFIFLTTFLTGDTEFFVRLCAVLSGSGLIWMVFLIAKDIFQSEKIGFFSSILMNANLLFPLGSIIITPDTPLAFFWTLSIFFFYRSLNSPKKAWWYMTGFTIGLSLLSKYTAFFIIPSFFFYLLFSSRNRKFLMTKEPYLMVVISLLVFSPVILWNYYGLHN
jgi:undecaprenyl-diphosphatase